MPEQLFLRAPDPGFRARAVTEYRTVQRWTSGEIDLNAGYILDYGCGEGVAAASFALRHPNCQVFGCDITPIDKAHLEKQIKTQLGANYPENLTFFRLGEGKLNLPEFHLIYSWSVFEHIPIDELEKAFRQVSGWLRSNGKFLLQIDPLYFSPRGSHLYRYFSQPWHHLLYSMDKMQQTVVQQSGNTAKRKRAWQQFLELNRVTAEGMIRCAGDAGLNLIRKQVTAVDEEPPESLLSIYHRKVLKASQLVALFD